MERLTTKDLLALLEFIKECYGVCDLDTFAQRVISKLPKIVPSDATTHNEFNLSRRQNLYLQHPKDVFSPAENAIFEQHMHEHPLINHYRKTGDPSPVKITDFLSQRQFHRLALYNEFFRLIGMEHQMAFSLSLSPPPAFTGIALNRSGKDFSEHDRLILELLSPHLIQAYRNAEAVTQTKGQLALVTHTLEKLDQGVIVLTRDGRITLANARAIQWITEYFGSRSALGNRLPEELQRWVKHHENLSEKNDHVPQPRNPFVMEREAKRLVVRHLCEQAQCVLLFDEQQTAPSPETFERLGLSRREAEVLLWVAQGKTNIEIGIILGLSPRTVQKHLERIYQKLGVENRTAAAAMAHEIVSGARRD